MVRKFLQYINGWKGIALICYMWLILMDYAVVYIDFTSPEAQKRLYAVSVAEVILIALIYICPRLLRFAESLKIEHSDGAFTQNQKSGLFIRTWAVTFAVLFVMYLIFYPGGFSPDNVSQYAQASGQINYNDWHPVLHTLIFYTLPLKITGGWIGSIVLFQIIIFSSAFAYTICVLAEYGNIKYAKLITIYTLISPASLGFLLFPMKDSAFAIASMLLMTFTARIYFSRGEWINSTKHIILFAVILAAATIFRHNAILFTLPLLFCVIFYARKFRRVLLPVIFIALVLFVKMPLYSSLNVEKPGYRQFETLGIPIAVIAEAADKTPERLDDDIVAFAQNLDKDKVEEMGYARILEMSMRCVKASPMVCLKKVLDVTDMVYGIAGIFIGGNVPYIRENSYGLDMKGISFLQRLYWCYSYGTMLLLKHIFWHLGVLHLALIVMFLAKASLRKLFILLPMFIYNFGTMLLLKIDDFRFFYYSLLIAPLLILILLQEDRKDLTLI